ncbi:MAG: NADH-quinone oxidoreductase subunit M [Candidatus Omnitrophica bacterium]|nr:NADH-quinone oxidoreductase subunit M [Candidatus Omnitrophota bacterium]
MNLPNAVLDDKNNIMLDITFLLVAIPALAALLISLLPSHSYRAIRAMAHLAMALELVLALFLIFSFDRTLAGFQFVTDLAWTVKPKISLLLGVDGISLWMVLLTAIVGWAALFATGNIQEKVKGFFLSYMTLVCGAMGTFMSLDLFFFFFFYEIEALVTYPLISIWGRGDRKYAAMQFTIFSVLGSAFVLIGILALYFLSGNTSLQIPQLLSGFETVPLAIEIQRRIFPLFFVGFGILAALWPFHAWGPIGYAEAPPAASMLFSGILKTLGAYGLIRVGLGLFPEAARAWMPALLALALVNLIYVGFVALAQKNLRLLIGYASASHMGFALAGIACADVLGISGALLILFAHGLLMALLFLLVYLMEEKGLGSGVSDQGGLAATWPVTATYFSLAALASLGIPGFANFAGELTVLFALFNHFGPWAAAGALVSVLLTALYMLRAVRNLFFGPEKELRHTGEEPVRHFWRHAPLVLLIGALIFSGFFPNLPMSYFKTSASQNMTTLYDR